MKTLLKRLSAVFLILLLTVGGYGSASAKSKKKKQTPTLDAEPLMFLPYAEKVIILDQTEDEYGLTWCLIEYEEEIGFVSRNDLVPEQPVPVTPSPSPVPTPDPDRIVVEEDGQYSDKEHVAEYLRQFGHLPDNYITKSQAQKLGWVSSYGNLWKVAPGKSIGGDRFGNYEGNLPSKKGRTWYECDIDFDGTYRNAKRILYSSDGLIYYTEDHYNTFEDITEK